MPNYLKQTIATFAAIMSLVLGMVALMSAVSASTGPWEWSDMSDKLTVRENRPVWAMAYAHPYWYMTDGQELYTGGHVWKTDGSVVSDITIEVRNAGLNRVDDIVSDGQTVIFLKNVVSATRNFEALSYRDGNWGYPAYTWQGKMDSNEAISSINGRDGEWMIVTTKGDVLRWKQMGNELTQLYLPNDARNNLDYSERNMIYNVNHGSAGSNEYLVQLSMLPLGNNDWLLTANTTQGLKFYKYYNNNFSDVTTSLNLPSLSPVYKVVSNGKTVLISTYGSHRGLSYGRVLTYDGTILHEIQNVAVTEPYWNTMHVTWNGKSWMMIDDGKKLYRLDNNRIESHGETRDYFVTLAGDENGRMLLGGAVSALGVSDPTSPLTAKLVRMDEGTGYVAPSTPTTDHGGNEVWIDMWVSNNEHNLYHGDSSRVYVAGDSPNGVDRIEILTYANGKQVHTCTGVEQCEITLYGSNYPKGSDISFNARLIDKKGHEAWTWLGEYHIPLDTETTPTPTASDRLSVWLDFDPSGTAVYDNSAKTINARASAVDGLQKIEIYVNQAVKRTCTFNRVYGTQNCSFTLYPNQYSYSNNQMTVYAKAYDYYGRQLVTNTQYLYRNGSDSGSGTDSSVSAWFDGNASSNTLGRTESRNITFYGNANRGLNRMELYANNNLVGTCSYNNAYGNQTCTKTIYGSSYSVGQSVSLKVKAIDRDGYYNWSSTVSFTVSNDGTNNGNVSAWFYMSPDGQNISNTETRTVQGRASAVDGLRNIKVYVNDSVKRTCTYSTVYGTQTCDYSLYGGTNYGSNTLYVKVSAEDRNGRVSWSDTKTYYLNQNNQSNSVYATLWFEPSDTTLSDNESKSMKASASADQGLQKIEIYVNNQLKRTCSYNRVYGNQTCDTTIYGYDYGSGMSIPVYAKAYDYTGRQTQTSTQYLTRDGGSQNNGNVYAWMWFDPSELTLGQDESKTIKVGSAADDWMQNVEIYANNQLKKTCTYNRAYGNQTCETTINGNDYNANSSIPVYAKAYDYNGKQTQATTQYIQIKDQVNPGAFTLTLNPDRTSYADTELITITAGWPVTGISRMEMYINDQLEYTCYNQMSCSLAVTPSVKNLPATTKFQAKAVTNNGASFWSASRTVSITKNNQNDVPGTITMTSNKEGGYYTNDQITFTANGADQNGIDRIEILVNAQLVKTCSGTGTCSYTGGPYSTYNNVTYAANLYDVLGNRVWTGYKSISKK